MLAGDAPGAIVRELGVTWAQVESYAARNDREGAWAYIQKQNRDAILARLQDRALAAVTGSAPTRKRRTVDGAGLVSTCEEHSIDSALIEKAAALTAPEVHGRQAGRQSPNQTAVIVNVGGHVDGDSGPFGV